MAVGAAAEAKVAPGEEISYSQTTGVAVWLMLDWMESQNGNSACEGRRPAPAPQSDGHGLAWLLFGRFEFVPISSPSLNQRVRSRYQGTLAELVRLGFCDLCSYGTTFSVFRLLLGIPALSILTLLPKRPVIGWWAGLRIGECCPLLTARDKGAWADADCEGVKFLTAFTDGTFLVSSNYRTLTLEGPVMTKRWRAGSIGELWAEHRSAVQSFEAAGRIVDRRTAFQEFADLRRRDYASF